MHFARWIQTIYWRTSLRRDEAKYFYRRISSCGSVTCSFRKDLLRICVFPSHLWVSDITELIKQLLKLYEALTERYSECVNWLEEDRNDNIFFDANLNPSTKAMQGQEQGRRTQIANRRTKRPWFYVVKDCKATAPAWFRIAWQVLYIDKFYISWQVLIFNKFIYLDLQRENSWLLFIEKQVYIYNMFYKFHDKFYILTSLIYYVTSFIYFVTSFNCAL